VGAVNAVLHNFGEAGTPVMVVDGIGPEPCDVVPLAAQLAPFPPAGNNYPGVRRVLAPADAAAWSYALALIEAATPYIAGAFELDGFDLVEASFSMVTTPAGALAPVQCAPHFDSVDPDYYAVLHYLSDCDGTAFYRHRAAGIETLSAATYDHYVSVARSDRPQPGFITDSTDAYVCIGKVAGIAGRLVAYPGRLLHSGIIPARFAGSNDPTHGRLTTNIFIRGHRTAPKEIEG